MSKARTWKVVEWSREKEWGGDQIPLQCEHCGRDAECPVLLDVRLAMPIGGNGMGLIFDTDPRRIANGSFPEVIECRKCKRQYSKWGHRDVEGREVVGVR